MLDQNNLPVNENNSNPENQEQEKIIIQQEPKQELEEQTTQSVSNEAIDEIENKIAESSESASHEALEPRDYKSFELEDLVAELTLLVKEKPVQSIQSNVNKIKSAFNVKFGKLLKKEKEKFLAEGGNIVDFQYQNPIKLNYNSILYDYKIKRQEYYSNQEKQLQENLDAKLELIEDLKQLIDNGDSESMYKNFKNIQQKWRDIGPIPKAKYNDTWRTYQHHVERFYDLLHLNNDLRELDFKHNLEEKQKLINRAQELAAMEDVNTAFKELQLLHKMWKEEIGPVAREVREEVWEQFSEATKQIHDKRHSFYKNLKSKFDDIIDEKIGIVNEIESIDITKNKSRGDWQKCINELEALRKKFFNAGQLPRGKRDDIWDRFKEATKKINAEKNKYFKEVKKEHLENLNKKKALIEQALKYKDSEEWETAADVMKKIQAEWKTIGHVPRKYSDSLWKEFKEACNHFFDRLHKKEDQGTKEQVEVFNKKKEVFSELKEAVEDNTEFTIEKIKEYIANWKNLGRVPYEMRHIEVKFNKLLDKIVENTDELNREEIEMIKFQNLVNSYLEQKNYKKLDSEQMFVRKKIDESIREIQQLENNIGFISNVSDDNPLVKNVRNQINDFKEKLSLWQAKLEYLRSLEY
jgi:hypothetical protein